MADPLRDEAVKLLERLAEVETDPGAKGYALGMAERLRENRRETVTEDYLAGLRRAVASQDAVYREVLHQTVRRHRTGLLDLARTVREDMDRLIRALERERDNAEGPVGGLFRARINGLGEIQATGAALNAKCGALDAAQELLDAYEWDWWHESDTAQGWDHRGS